MTTGEPAIERLLSDRPAFHIQGSSCYGLDDEVLRFIGSRIEPGSCTLETGAGLSTILLAMKGCRHICITPVQDEEERIRAYCEAQAISLAGVSFLLDRSENVLPGLKDLSLDLVLIDGGHGFPIPFVDWLYAGRWLKKGGLLMVDDTQLWTGRVLKQFLLAEPGWQYEGEWAARTAVFRRMQEGEMATEWCCQPFFRRRQRWLNMRFDIKYLLWMLRNQQFAALRKNLAGRIRKHLGLRSEQSAT